MRKKPAGVRRASVHCSRRLIEVCAWQALMTKAQMCDSNELGMFQHLMDLDDLCKEPGYATDIKYAARSSESRILTRFAFCSRGLTSQEAASRLAKNGAPSRSADYSLLLSVTLRSQRTHAGEEDA